MKSMIGANHDSPQRKQIRLKNYDYSQNGYYFVTICTQNRENVFGEIVGANHDSPVPKMVLNEFGKIIDSVWESLPKRFPIVLDEFQIMPNHVHMIIHIVVRAIHESPLRKRSLLSQIIGYLKMNSTKIIRNSVLNVDVGANHDSPNLKNNSPIWQRNYYERIIRNETEYVKIKEYIQQNPVIWERDRNNPNLGIH